MKKKQIPQLTSNYGNLISTNSYFVDKTAWIPRLEALHFPNLFFLRPRRFGKSLLISMLEHYYGIEHKERFNELFGEYYIGQPGNPTPLRNSYYTMHLDFSGINTQVEKDIMKSFNEKLIIGINDFAGTYDLTQKISLEKIFDKLYPSDMISAFLSEVKLAGISDKLYLFIDEYDHFTNELFAFNKDHFTEIVSRNGWVRKFYEVIKQFMGDGLIDRFFATGVTPVTLDSMTSGFNVARNISLEEKFHEMAGFTEVELKKLIEGTIYEEGKFDLNKVVTDMRSWYNGSKFSVAAPERLYNPQMVITFLSKFSERYQYPDEMADHNVTSDYKKISNILGYLPVEESDSIIEEILDTEGISEKLTLQFNFELPYTRKEAISLLYYNGLLTLKSSAFQVYDMVIPNHVIKVMYWDYFRALFEMRNKVRYESVPMRDALIEMATVGKIDKLVGYVQRVLGKLSNRDLQNFSEKNLKMIFMTLLIDNSAYFIKSEPENNAGYADLLLIPTQLNPGKTNFLLELKYLKTDDKSLLETEKQKAIEQVSRYRNSIYAEGTECNTFVILFTGKNEYVVEQVHDKG